ncbi:hypothetical protein GGI05_000833, partial [Coemansia sp. RSA 2603]
ASMSVAQTPTHTTSNPGIVAVPQVVDQPMLLPTALPVDKSLSDPMLELKHILPKFTGVPKVDCISAKVWTRRAVQLYEHNYGIMHEGAILGFMLGQLDGEAKETLDFVEVLSIEMVAQILTGMYPHRPYQVELTKIIQSGEAFSKTSQRNVIGTLNAYLNELNGNVHSILAIAEATRRLLLELCLSINLDENNATYDSMQTTLAQLSERIQANPRLEVTLFGKAALSVSKPKPTVALRVQPTKPQPQNMSYSQQAEMTKNQRRRMRAKQSQKEMQELRDELAALKKMMHKPDKSNDMSRPKA